MPEEHPLDRYVNSLIQAATELNRAVVYASEHTALLSDMHVFGEGPDVSYEELAYADIAGMLQARFVLRLADFIGKPGKDKEEEYREDGSLDLNQQVFSKKGKKTWSLKFLIPQIYHAGIDIWNETQKDEFQKIYQRYLAIAFSADFADLKKLRDQGIAHLCQGIAIHNPSGSSTLSKYDDYLKRVAFAQEAITIACDILDLVSSRATLRSEFVAALSDEHKSIKQGLQPMILSYRHALQASMNSGMTRRTDPPSIAEALQTDHIVWQSTNGQHWCAEKVAARRWRLFQNVNVGGVDGKAVIAETGTPKEAKEIARAAAITGNAPNAGIRLNAIQYAEHIRNTLSSELSAAGCVWSIMLVATEETPDNWDGYMGVDTPVQFTFVCEYLADKETIGSIASGVSGALKGGVNITVSCRFCQIEEIKEAVRISPTMMGNGESPKFIQILPCSGDLPSWWTSEMPVILVDNTTSDDTAG